MVVSGDERRGITGPQFSTPDVKLTPLKSEPFFGDLGYSLPLPWPDITTAGWWDIGTIPEEKVLVTRGDPEYFALNDRIRTNAGLPTHNVNDAIYKFDRSNYTFPVASSVRVPNWGDYVRKTNEKKEKDFRNTIRI